MKTFVFLLVTLQALSPTLNAPLKDSTEVAELEDAEDAEPEPPQDGVHDHEDPVRDGKWTFNFNPGPISISDHSFAGEYEKLSVGHYANVKNIEGNQITENVENEENVETIGGDKITETNENVGNVNNVENVETASGLSAAVSCRGGATSLSTSPRLDMVLCKDKTESTCEKDFESLCPAGWNLCHPKQFNNRNHGWDYNWEDANDGSPLGVIYCDESNGGAGHYVMGRRDLRVTMGSNTVLSTDQPLNCHYGSSRPGCELYAGPGWDCDEKGKPALCCAPTSTCGDGQVQQEEEDCDSNLDDCLNSCTWRKPKDHGLSGC